MFLELKMPRFRSKYRFLDFTKTYYLLISFPKILKCQGWLLEINLSPRIFQVNFMFQNILF